MTAECTQAVAHYAALAKKPGWYAYACDQVHKLEADKSGLFRGIKEEFVRLLKAAKFVVPANERGEWWK